MIVCGPEDSSELWIWNTETGELKTKVNHSPDDSLTSAAWHPEGREGRDNQEYLVTIYRGECLKAFSIFGQGTDYSFT